MTTEDKSKETPDRKTSWKQVLVSVAVLAGAAILMLVIFSTEPEAVRETATKRTAMLVSVENAQAGNYRPVIEVMGTVIPFREVMLRPRIEGEVLEVSPEFVPGRVVEKGHPLLRIDPADYEIALQLRESEVLRAEADLTLEKGRREIARRDLERMGEDLSTENRALVLREPQYQTAQAAVKAARASAKQAELNLDRTRIDAPFHAKILQRYVNAGSQVSPQTQLAHLVDVDQFWVEATVPLRVLPRLEFQENPDEAGVEVTIRDASGSGVVRTGSLDQLIGSLDDQTRMARILVRVEDPLQLNSGDHSARLLLGSFVRLEVPVREFSNVVRLNRDHVHPGETVWVMSDEDALEIREVEVAFRDRTHAYIRSGVDEGERVVTSQLATVSEGAALRVEETDSSQETEESQGSDS